jgi:predicted DNA-binding ribbon-helix-helix protein
MSRIVKRSLVIAGHATSISLEEPFWLLLKRAAAERGLTIAAMVETIDRERMGTNLSSAIRVHLVEWLMARGSLDLIPARKQDQN